MLHDHALNYNTVHRDISPSNVLINDNGIPKLSGFGLSDAVAVLSYEGHKGGRDQNDVVSVPTDNHTMYVVMEVVRTTTFAGQL